MPSALLRAFLLWHTILQGAATTAHRFHLIVKLPGKPESQLCTLADSRSKLEEVVMFSALTHSQARQPLTPSTPTHLLAYVSRSHSLRRHQGHLLDHLHLQSCVERQPRQDPTRAHLQSYAQVVSRPLFPAGQARRLFESISTLAWGREGLQTLSSRFPRR